MDITFQRPAEAMAAITWVVCAADDVGSPEEHNFIHRQVKQMDLFAEMSEGEFTSILAVTRTKLFNALPNNGFCLSDLGAKAVLKAANDVLNQDQKAQAIKMATELAKSDKLVGVEKVILDSMQEIFGTA